MALPRIVVTGSECTGKSTLARSLARHYGTVVVPEFARSWVEAAGAAPTAADVEAIARGQIASEDRLEPQASGLLILDTDLTSTVVYARHYFGSVDAWIEAEAARRRGDLYLLCDIDVPWVADGLQRDRPEAREHIQELFREALRSADVAHVTLRGDPDSRLESAVAAIDALPPV